MSPDELKELIRESLREQLNLSYPGQGAEDELLSGYEVCQLLRISKPTLLKRVRDGIIPCYKQGNRTYYKRSEVEGSLTRKNPQP